MCQHSDVNIKIQVQLNAGVFPPNYTKFKFVFMYSGYCGGVEVVTSETSIKTHSIRAGQGSVELELMSTESRAEDLR